MKDYWLAKLIDSVTEVDSRKRLQKSIYLLQVAGCPLQFDYLLHYYGPYSFELAGLIDSLHGAEVIEETPDQLPSGVIRYKSAITDKGRTVLRSFERTQAGQRLRNAVVPFIDRFRKLNQEDPWVLELAATVAYYHETNWAAAQRQTATFKKISESDTRLKRAVKLARSFKKSA